jgi:ABC-type histidine transport system ATPase subunit
MEDEVEQLAAVMEVTSRLADATNDRTMSLLPTDLQTTNFVLDQVINILDGSANRTEIDTQPEEVFFNPS